MSREIFVKIPRRALIEIPKAINERNPEWLMMNSQKKSVKKTPGRISEALFE